ncbi:MAG: ATP-binding protein [Myxococcales bacterium]|nr:ATP-binding protein [Myxococcales bacterium]
MEFTTRFFQAPRQSFFLLGPRGTGKSLFAQKAFPEALRIDLLEPDVFRTYSARPERLRELVLGRPDVRNIVIDEVQKVPELLPAVHALIERRRGLRFILTGSSARKLKRAGVDLLGGRAVMRSLHPYMAAELGSRFSLDEALSHGLLPLVLAADEPRDVLRAYAALYLREEVQLEGLVRSVGAFSRFLEAVSFSHAAPVNLAAVARDCQVERKTVEGYVEVLEDLLLAFRLPVFTRRAKRELAAHPKLFFFDAGVYRSLRPSGPLDSPEEIAGPALEGLVAQHLRAWIAYTDAEHQLFCWRTRSGVEVDLVLYGARGLFAFEVKNAARLRGGDLRGLKSFREDYPDATCALLYRGPERLLVDGIPCLPVGDFLTRLHPGELASAIAE